MLTTFDPPNLEFPFRVNDLGGVDQFKWRKFNWEPLVGNKDNIGYYIANWTPRGGSYIPGKRVFDKVHRIVWMTHKGEIPKNFEIDHIDGDKSNNSISNLRLVTHKENLALARQRLGNWAKGKLLPHQIQLTVDAPSFTNWQFLADRWGVHKFTLLNLRVKAKKAILSPS